MSLNETVLIAEDRAESRAALIEALQDEYALLQAQTGQETLSLLSRAGCAVCAILARAELPDLPGPVFLRALRDAGDCGGIPVILLSGDGRMEDEALRLGAWDYIAGPTDGGIVKLRLRNAIERSQLTAREQLKYLSDFDTLTGIYNKAKFFSAARKMLDGDPEGQYAFVRMDIDRFQLINSFFGIEEGDKLLSYLAGCFPKGFANSRCCYGRMEADVFAFLFAYPSREEILRQLENFKARIRSFNGSFDIVPIFGVCLVDDHSLPISEMLDRAALAAKTCKGKYLNTTALFTPDMIRSLEKEQGIINEMNAALNGRQFCVYLQPKYSLQSNLPAGAEALVRWRHPQKGLISPGEFIPVFEKNGFIAKLDYFVWETVCALLHDWISRGLAPNPVSVNVSRVNLYNPHLVSLLKALLDKYALPPELLQLELTESAYMDKPQMMEQTVSQLHAAGFTILMDDFGSGYSSLSVLKDVEVDILKIDMRFFEKTRISGRGENIVASIVRMAKWLNLPVTAEGVETREQVEFLRGVGCDWVQGYYFARPMPPEAYETLCRAQKTAATTATELYARLNPDKLFSLEPEMLLLFSDDPAAKAIYEFDGRDLEVLRVNNSFKKLFGTGDGAQEMNPFRYIVPEHRDLVVNGCRSCVEGRAVRELEYRSITPDGRLFWIRMELQYVQQIGKKHILMGHMADITPLKTLEQKYNALVVAAPRDLDFSLNKTFSLRSLRALVGFLSQVFEAARLVDPVNTALVELREDGRMELMPYSCFKVWSRETRCENCSSICAARSGCRMTKYEYVRNDIFYVVSNPVEVEDAIGEKHALALELVSRVSSHMALDGKDDAAEGEALGREIKSARRKAYADELTGAYNRRYLDELLFAHDRQTGVASSLGLILVEIEGPTEAMKAAAEAMKGALRETDSLVRFAEKQFAATLPDCAEPQAREAALRLTAAVGSLRAGEGRGLPLRAQVGWAFEPRFRATREALGELLLRAQAALRFEREKIAL